MLAELEIRTLDGVRADVADGRPPRLVGTAIVYGVPSRDLGGFREVIAPDAARFDDLVALVNHDTSRVLGRVSARTLRVTEDARGLHFEVDPPAHAADVVESIARGDTPGVSFAFSGARDSWDMTTTPPTRTIHEMRVHELSLGVAFPAYEQAHAVALRSLASAKETPMPETTVTVESEPVPPVPVVATETRDVEIVGEERILRPGDSMRSWTEARDPRAKEYGNLRLGDVLRALITGPRNDLERRALSEGTDSAGGFTVPDILLSRWIDRLRNALVVVRAGASTVPLTSDVTKIARLATDPVPAWRAEAGAVAESDPTFEAVTFAPKSLDVFTKVSRELLEDSLNISEMLEVAFTRAFAVEVDRVCLHGTGTPPQPRGLRTTTGLKEVSMTTNGAALTSYDKILDLVGELWAANVTPDPVAIMAPRTLTTLSKLKTGIADDNTPLRRPAVLEGWSFLPTANMPINETQGSASNASSLFIGDWSMLMLGFRTTMGIEVARELFRGTYQYGFFGHLRFDMQVAQPPAFGRLIGIIP